MSSNDQQASEEAMPDNEMPDYIQEEDEEEDPFYFVQPQQRSHGNIYLAASVGDIDRVRCCFFRNDQLMETSVVHINHA